MARQILTPDNDFLKTLTILHVEDDPDIHIRLNYFLKRHVKTLLTAMDGEEGLKMFQQQQPDIIITDILMPTMDGLTMTKAIRDLDMDIPIIVTTAYNDEEFFLRSIDLGIDRYVLKPTDPKILFRALTHCAGTLWRRREKEQANRYVRFILDIQPNLLLVVDNGQLEYINQAFLNFLGFESLEAFLNSEVQLENLILTRDGTPLSVQGDPDGSWLMSLLATAGEHRVVYLRATDKKQVQAIPFAVTFNSLPELKKHLFSFSDITHLEQEKLQLEEQAFTDSLTGTCNRARLQGVLNTELRRAHRHEMPLSIIMCDIDHFKRVNDVYGHQAGDDVLRQVATLMAANIRAEDILARWGGEEFMIVSPLNDLENMRLVAEKLRSIIASTPFPAVGQLTCSFGVAQRKPDDTIRDLTERADKALYAAKTGGRNRVEFAL
ncbi:MAG: diguanylate cyclase [Magnetococcales bacterium]|nr:diguanylate cyclase [Magnetococcales bacterium]MBF0439549.1 diguanylate cyclase [Magnetococcales bacterium]